MAAVVFANLRNRFTKFFEVIGNPKYFSAFIDIADRKFTLYVCQTAHGAYITTPTVYRRNIDTRYSVKTTFRAISSNMK